MSKNIHWGGAIAIATVLGATPVQAEAPQESMREIFAAIVELLPISAKDDGFADPDSRAASQKAFERLAAATQGLGDHAETRDADFLQRSRSLTAIAGRAKLAFELERFDETRFAVFQLTQACIGCHARLPDPVDSALAERWLEEAGLDGLVPEERARLYVATRRFDDALGIYEEVLADPRVAPFDADVTGLLGEYLAIALRVKRDPERVRRTLVQLGNRSDAPRYLNVRTARWARDLAALENATPAKKAPLERARELAERTAAWDSLPFLRDGLALDLVATGILLEWLDAGAKGASPAEVAEAWYRLALLDERIASVTAFPRTEVYLEAALRSDPSGKLAARSYERLEEFVLTDFGAPTVEALPLRERDRLEELAQLLAAGDAPDA